MRCPRCTLADLNETTQKCVLCGYSAVPSADAPPAAPPSPTELDARRELARDFRIERLLEHSSTPIAYVARDAEDRVLTLKVVPLDQLGAPADRVLAAVEAAQRLDHPHIVPVHDAGTTEHFLWYATRYVEGRTLGSILGTARAIELPVCLRTFEQVASALDHAHRRGVTHGALTAECIIVDANEWVLVGDFGTAGLLGPPPAAGPATSDREALDQHALATIVRQCLAGAEGSGHPAAPLHVTQALRRALSVRAADRFPSVLDFVAALGGGGTRPEARPAWFGSKPRQGPGAPVVIADSDADPAAPRARGRVAAAAGLAIAVAASAAWLGRSSVPAALPTRAAASPPATVSPPPAGLPAPGASSAARDTERPSPSVAAPAAAAAPTRSAPVRTPVAPAAPAPAGVERHAEPALLSVNAIPWGSVYLDGRPIGNTPQIDLAVPPGTHRLRVERNGFRPYDRVIQVAPGQRLRITDIALVER